MLPTECLEEFVDRDSSFGMVYRKGTAGQLGQFEFESPCIVLPRCSSQFEVHFPTEPIPLDVYQFAFIPQGTQFSLLGHTSISDIVIFILGKEAVARAAKIYELDILQSFQSHKRPLWLSRTNWINEIMHRYVYERCIARVEQSVATAFLEPEIVKETFFRIKEQDDRYKSIFDFDAKALDRRGPVLRRAMTYIEANLFRRLTIQDLVKATAISESTLLRTFKSYFGSGPSTYIQHRRLEEARNLLKSGTYSVSQVSDMIGYESASSFTTAFRKKFGQSPQHFLEQG